MSVVRKLFYLTKMKKTNFFQSFAKEITDLLKNQCDKHGEHNML